MNKKDYAGIILIVTIIAVIAAVLYPKEKSYGELDTFAKCLASKGITMYGAAWCPHCQNEKNRFGQSFRFVPYVECPKEPDKCIAAGISGYPTWLWPDGKKLEGDQELGKIAEESGCPLAGQ